MTSIVTVKSRKYDWPSEPYQTWRHITNYAIKDTTGIHRELFDEDFVSASYCLRGLLLPRPGEQVILLPHKVYVKSYSIDFGKTPIDSNRGLWVEGDDLIWYHLEYPAEDYFPIALRMQKMIDGFFDIYDALLFSEFAIEYNENTAQYTCKRPIQEVFATIKKVINKNFLIKNHQFVLDHLGSVIDFKGSSALKQSIAGFADYAMDDEGQKTELPPSSPKASAQTEHSENFTEASNANGDHDNPSNRIVLKRKIVAQEVDSSAKIASIEGRLLCKRKDEDDEITKKIAKKRISGDHISSGQAQTAGVKRPHYHHVRRNDDDRRANRPVSINGNVANIVKTHVPAPAPQPNPSAIKDVSTINSRKEVLARWREYYLPSNRSTGNTASSADSNKASGVPSVESGLSVVPSSGTGTYGSGKTGKKLRIAVENNQIIRFFINDPPSASAAEPSTNQEL